MDCFLWEKLTFTVPDIYPSESISNQNLNWIASLCIKIANFVSMSSPSVQHRSVKVSHSQSAEVVNERHNYWLSPILDWVQSDCESVCCWRIWTVFLMSVPWLSLMRYFTFTPRYHAAPLSANCYSHSALWHNIYRQLSHTITTDENYYRVCELVARPWSDTQTRLNQLKSCRLILASVPAWLKSDECDRSFVTVTHTFQMRDPLMINLKTMRTSTWIRQGNLTQTSLFSVISVWVCPHPAVSHVKVRLKVMMASLCASERQMMNSVSDCHHHNRREVVSCTPSVCCVQNQTD